MVGLADACKGADWLITGEGRSDTQTLLGKTPFAAAQIARQHGNAALKATLISGGVDATALAVLNKQLQWRLLLHRPRPDGARSGRHPGAGTAGQRGGTDCPCRHAARGLKLASFH